MSESQRPKLNLSRGLCGTLVSVLAGAALAVVMMYAYTVCHWIIFGSTEFDRCYDLQMVRNSVLWPIIGCATVCGCTGWITFAPEGSFRFAKSLALIFFISLPLWFLGIAMGMTDTRNNKSISHPDIYPSELLLITVPPIIVAGFLTSVRLQSHSKSEKSNE